MYAKACQYLAVSLVKYADVSKDEAILHLKVLLSIIEKPNLNSIYFWSLEKSQKTPKIPNSEILKFWTDASLKHFINERLGGAAF